MANEYQLSYAANEIDNRLGMAGNAILYTEQNLTEEQKAQARANIGIILEDEENIVTEEIKCEYDGDNASDDKVWITNYNNLKVLVKIGEIPKGTINLVGSTIFRTNPNNQWLDRTFTITEGAFK